MFKNSNVLLLPFSYEIQRVKYSSEAIFMESNNSVIPGMTWKHPNNEKK